MLCLVDEKTTRAKHMEKTMKYEEAKKIAREHGFRLSRPYANRVGGPTLYDITAGLWHHGPYFSLEDAVRAAKRFSRKDD